MKQGIVGFWLALTAFSYQAAQAAVIDISKQVGITEITDTWGAYPVDYNKDGWVDLLIGRHRRQPARLYRNTGGKFQLAWELPRKDRHGCAWGDVNRDGRPDLYCTIGANRGVGSNPKELWIQQQNGTFKDMASKYGVTDIYGRGRAATFIKANGDKFFDLLTVNASLRPDGILAPSRLFINRLGTSFRNAPEYGMNHETVKTPVPGCAQAADFNRDGREDLLVCEETVRLYRNDRGARFVDVTQQSGILLDGGYMARLVDLDGDGWLDFVKVRRREYYIQFQSAGRLHAPAIRGVLESGVAVAVGDVNGDKLQDIYIVQGHTSDKTNKPDILLRNLGAGRFTSVTIPQATSGHGESAVMLDINNDGRDEVVVLNGLGESSPGPIQVLRLRGAQSVLGQHPSLLTAEEEFFEE